MIKIIALFIFILPLDVHAQHPESFLSYELDENWIKQNKINEIEVGMRWTKNNGKLRKRKEKTNFFYGLEGYELIGKIISLTKTDSTLIRCFRKKSFSYYDTLCYETKFNSAGAKVLFKAKWSEVYYLYDSLGRLNEMIINNYPSIAGWQAKLVSIEYNEMGKPKKEIVRTLNKNYEDYVKSKQDYKVISCLVYELSYLDNGNMKEVKLYRGKDPDNLEYYRKIEFLHDRNTNFPLSAVFFNFENGEKILERIDEYEYTIRQ